jgi:hypothetical protein
MLHNISWGQFFTVSAGCLIAYYIGLGCIYYRWELLALVSGQRKLVTPPVRVTKNDASRSFSPLPEEEEDDLGGSFAADTAGVLGLNPDKERELTNDADCLIEELADLFYVCRWEEWTKAELVPLLKKKLRQYPQFGGSSFVPTFQSYIIDRAREECNMTFSVEEIKALW